MPVEIESSETLARDYRHQLHDEALARARLLVTGCCEVFRTKSEDAGMQYILQAAREIAEEVVGKDAANTFVWYCRSLWHEDTAREKKWRERTTNDAIDEAFAALTARGIVALQNCGGTQSMGWAVVNEELHRRTARKKPAIGGTFFHAQDLERAIAGDGLLLVFGAVDGSDNSACAVAREVIEVLGTEGVACEWDGSAASRIRILPFEWRKRRITRPPAKQPTIPWRHFAHADGRRWSVAGLNNRVCLRFGDPTGEITERQTPSRDTASAIAELVASQLADGFREAG